MLSEGAGTVVRIGDRGILKSLIGGDRHFQNRPSAGGKDAMEFTQGLAVVVDLLQDMAPIDDVEGRVGIFDVRDVHLLHKVITVEKWRSVAGAKRAAKPGVVNKMWGHVDMR